MVHLEREGRYVLFLDLLGFSRLVEAKDAVDVYNIVEQALGAFKRWEKLNSHFRTIFFSDSFIFYQREKGWGSSSFLDAYAIGGLILSALLAKGIPARGAITFGEFEVRADSSKTHDIYFGRVLIEAYRAEQSENWIGISIQKSAWKPYEQGGPGTILAFADEGVWIMRQDEVLLLNPFIKMRGWYDAVLCGEVRAPYWAYDAPEFQNELDAIAFLDTTAESFAKEGDFTGRVAAKYHATVAFLKQVMGAEQYSLAVRTAADRIQNK